MSIQNRPKAIGLIILLISVSDYTPTCGYPETTSDQNVNLLLVKSNRIYSKQSEKSDFSSV